MITNTLVFPLVLTLGWAANPPAESSSDDVEVKGAVKQFEKSYFRSRSAKNWRKAHEVLDSIEQSIAKELEGYRSGGESEDSYFRSVRAFAAKVSDPIDFSKSEFKERRKKNKKSQAQPHTFPLPRDLAYGFGTRDLRPLQKELAKTMKARAKAGEGLALEDLTPSHALEALLRGCQPELELALAAIQRELDIDRSGDRFSRFLESWRNTGPDGDESFYEAIDRTAGSEESVFFYDMMLGEFAQRFEIEEAKRSVDVAHDLLHQAFLTYRQYRGMIEAVSYAILLPREVALPARLARYDYDSTKGLPEGKNYSLRHSLDILVELHHGDLGKVVAFVQDVLRENPLPEELWSGESYSPVHHFNQAFLSVAFSGVDAQDLLQRQWQRSAERAARLRALSRVSLARLGVTSQD